jgi:hypothetical protein
MADDAAAVADLLGRRLDEVYAKGTDATPIFVALRAYVDASPAEAATHIRAYLDHRFDEQLLQHELDAPDDPAYVAELQRWLVGASQFLRPELSEFAKSLFEALLLDIRAVQEGRGIRLHKGAPYHNLGVAELLQNDLDGAHDYFILAALEDALIASNWDEGAAAAMLRAYWNGDVELPRVSVLAKHAAEYDKKGDGRHALVFRNPELLLMLHRPA